MISSFIFYALSPFIFGTLTDCNMNAEVLTTKITPLKKSVEVGAGDAMEE